STRLLKRPGERPRVAKPQPSEQGLPPRSRRGPKRRKRPTPPQKRRRRRKPKRPRRDVKRTQKRQGTGRGGSRPLQRRQSSMSPTVRLRSRRQTTGPQSSTRLLKRPGERPRVAKPQPSEQGLPPRRKPGAKLRSRRSARQQRRRGSKPSSER